MISTACFVYIISVVRATIIILAFNVLFCSGLYADKRRL